MTASDTSAIQNMATQPARASRKTRLRLLIDLYRSRRALEGLDAHQLRDIGISEDLAHAEAARPIWDVPQSWLR